MTSPVAAARCRQRAASALPLLSNTHPTPFTSPPVFVAAFASGAHITPSVSVASGLSGHTPWCVEGCGSRRGVLVRRGLAVYSASPHSPQIFTHINRVHYRGRVLFYLVAQVGGAWVLGVVKTGLGICCLPPTLETTPACSNPNPNLTPSPTDRGHAGWHRVSADDRPGAARRGGPRGGRLSRPCQGAGGHEAVHLGGCADLSVCVCDLRCVRVLLWWAGWVITTDGGGLLPDYVMPHHHRPPLPSHPTVTDPPTHPHPQRAGAMLHPPGLGAIAPLAAGVTLFACLAAGGQFTGLSPLNPAITFASSLIFDCYWRYSWM